jgi:catechol 2,3-dioxygenase-like lactoylglutathione lyase family enzyme
MIALTGISAVTLATHDMARAVAFYEALGFVLKFGGSAAQFTRLRAGSGYLNLMSMPAERIWTWWGRAIIYVDDVDAPDAEGGSHNALTVAEAMIGHDGYFPGRRQRPDSSSSRTARIMAVRRNGFARNRSRVVSARRSRRAGHSAAR